MNTATRLSTAFLRDHPDDAARILERFAAEDEAAVFAGCEPAITAGVVQRMTADLAAASLAHMPSDQSAAVIELMPIAIAALIVRHWTLDAQGQVFETLPSQTADALRSVLSYPPGTVGALMDPLAFALPSDITVAEARQRVEDAGQKVLYYLYIVDRDHKLVGVLNLREFILASAGDPISSIMNKQVVKLKAAMGLEHIADSPDRRRYLSLPVVDGRGTFLGVLSNQTLYDAERLADRGRSRQSAVDTVMALGELYWVTLSGMLAGAQPSKRRSEADRRNTTEPPDAH